MTLPITLYSHASGPNPWKVAIVLEELALAYETKFVDFKDIKGPEYTAINPNGRVPSIHDPNTGITLWESGAIIEYLVATYDKEGRISIKTEPDLWLVKQWLYFQMSGQGPYFGQAGWFAHFHAEKIPSAQERYFKEVRRVFGVLNTVLEGKQYLVGNKCTVADLSFVTWDVTIPWVMGADTPDFGKEFPHYYAWHKRLTERPAVKKVLEAKAAAMAASH
ncbi:MAG: glutathione S- transferase, nitrogen catabolite repression regulator [Trizodia sp. TS-e1964]|nr:MAG: glutathione S- transferase, nitrogen catabolite repression regulator [Trizodia sp. TS-e1964]